MIVLCERRNSFLAMLDMIDTEEKDDHGNEEMQGFATTGDKGASLQFSGPALQYVDHTQQAKGLSKVKIFYDILPGVVEEEYNKFLADNQGKIKTQGAQFETSREENHKVVFAIALYYEEVAK